jgi:hypothetical protein
LVLVEITFSQEEGRSKVNQQVFVMCFGVSGRRILTHLTHYYRSETMQLTVVDNIKSIPTLLESLRQMDLVLVSRLDDCLLTEALSLLKHDRQVRKVRVTGLFIYPTIGIVDLSATIIANSNLRKSYQVLDRVRVVNLPDYDEGGIRPRWPLQFYDKLLSDNEKQVIWELMRCYQPIDEVNNGRNLPHPDRW